MPYAIPQGPVIQLALDFLNLSQAQRAAEEAVPAGVTWLEAGTPLIKSVGIQVLRELRQAFPDVCLVADMKTMDAGRVEVDAAHRNGADVAMVLAAASDATIRECVEAGQHLGIAIGCDLVACADPVQRAREVAALGVDLVSVHTPIDQQMEGRDGLAILAEVSAAVDIPVACAGGLSPASIPQAVANGARICIVGGAITKAPDNRKAAEACLQALAGASPSSKEGLYQREGLENIRSVLARVSTSNVSDAMHRGGAIAGLTNRNPGPALCGPAVTVATLPGDWSKPVQAIDRCQPGDVLVIDAAGSAPALWGGLATRTAILRRLAGVVIHGACRDVEEICGSSLSVWSSLACPNAGEPHGVGTIGCTVVIGGQSIAPGDWLVGDASGLVVIPGKRVVEIANRSQDIMEREQRYAAEIDAGRTLSQVAELSRWER
ncbi:MAG: bifunctional hexulose-6-phosphate synthase/ribonuclease regulator [Planctomycetota bacterium]|nr:MAG: bifunctional hexulose-6-phosphate synthase/ribonuclease regulator [Planctomycetota bacterium]